PGSITTTRRRPTTYVRVPSSVSGDAFGARTSRSAPLPPAPITGLGPARRDARQRPPPAVLPPFPRPRAGGRAWVGRPPPPPPASRGGGTRARSRPSAPQRRSA